MSDLPEILLWPSSRAWSKSCELAQRGREHLRFGVGWGVVEPLHKVAESSPQCGSALPCCVEQEQLGCGPK